MEESKISKKKKQNRLRQRKYQDRLKNEGGPVGDKLRQKHRKSIRKAEKKRRLKIIESDPVKKLRRIRKLIKDIFWDNCVEELSITEDMDGILSLRAPSYLKNKKQRKLLQEYVELYSSEIYFGDLTKKNAPKWQCWPDSKKIFKNKEVISLSEKVKIKSKYIQIPSKLYSEASDSTPRANASSFLVIYNQILIFRKKKFYISEKLKEHKDVVSINRNMKSRYSNSRYMKFLECPGSWLANNFNHVLWHAFILL